MYFNQTPFNEVKKLVSSFLLKNKKIYKDKETLPTLLFHL